jgi:4-hydroxybenzoate polyprenyltransferase
VERTRTRPLANQSLGLGEAYIVLFVLLCAALVLVLQLNVGALLWSICGLTLAILYPFCKRFFSAPQLVLGFAFSWSIPMVYSAGGFSFDKGFICLWLGAVLWIIVYDTFYALVDKTDDLKIGVRSTAILFGNNVDLITGFLQVLVLVLWAMVGVSVGLGQFYFYSLLFVFILFVRQQLLIRSSNSEQVFKAFTENHYVGLCLFVGIFTDLLFGPH